MNYNVIYSGRGNNYIQVGSAHDAMAEAGRKEAEMRYNQLIDQLVAALPQEIETAVYLSFEQNKGLLLGETAQKMFSDHLAADLKTSLDRLKISIG